MSDAALAPRAFAASLRELIEARRSFGGHPLWRRIRDGGVERPDLQIFAAQFFLQFLDGSCQRGLSDMTMLGRACEIQCFSDLKKISDLVHLHENNPRRDTCFMYTTGQRFLKMLLRRRSP